MCEVVARLSEKTLLENVKIMVTDKPLTVYKVGSLLTERTRGFLGLPWFSSETTWFVSGVQGFKYEPGKIYKVSFTFGWKLMENDSGILEPVILSGRGFYSYPDLPFSSDGKIFECTIPAGSEYYLSEDGKVIVSNRIRIDKVITWKPMIIT